MPPPDDVEHILEQLQIREYDEDIFQMSYSKLRHRFCFAGGNLHTSRLIRNLIWQDHAKIGIGELPQTRGNIRTYWYERCKPVLSRAKARKFAHKYDMMIGQFVSMVVDCRLFSYSDFGFTDEGAHNRKLGAANRHVLCVAEKAGHMPLLQQLAADYDCTIVALGGQPSALSSEYLLGELAEAGLFQSNDQHDERPVPLLTIVDYDPAGDSIAKSFIWQLGALGLTHQLQRIDLAHPSRMSPEQIKLNKYRLSTRKSERKKNQKWAAKTAGLTDYDGGLLYGIEADAMSWQQLTDAFDAEVTAYLDVPRDQIVRRRLKAELGRLMKELLLIRLGVG